MNRFRYRKIIPEIIDDFNWSGKELNQNLEEIEWINKNLGGTNTSAYPILHYIQNNLRQELKIVDIGCGSGDLLKKIQLACEGIKKIELIGVDANESIIEFAQKQHFQNKEISFVHADVINNPQLIPAANVYIMNLFLHHFEDTDIKQIMDNLLHTGPALIVINDLERSQTAYMLYKFLCKIKSVSFVTVNDGKLSILKGFSKNEMKSIGNIAHGYRYTLKWHWAYRWQLIIRRN